MKNPGFPQSIWENHEKSYGFQARALEQWEGLVNRLKALEALGQMLTRN